MQIYQIFMNELHANVKFKVLTVDEASEYLDKIKNVKDKKKKILQDTVFNLKTDVAGSLSMMSRTAAERALDAIYAGCIMLNPSLDLEYWLTIAYMTSPIDEKSNPNDPDLAEIKRMLEKAKKSTHFTKNNKNKKITKQKFLGLEFHLKNNVIGQDEAIDQIVAALARSQAELNDPDRPLGSFLFAGSSGVGKTHLAQCLHKYLFDENTAMIRIDCGEYQHKHENQKLLGSPPGYVGHDDGGQLTNQVKKNPNSVILIDEVEKAHPDIWNTFLRIFDEGAVTDSKGDLINFKNTIIIMTTNLGNEKTVDNLISTGTGFTGRIDFQRSTTKTPPRSLVEKYTNEAINKYFRPEFINRIDKIVVFNHLSRENCEKIAELELNIVAEKLSRRGLSIQYTDKVIDGLIEKGIDTIKGARGISQVRRDTIETPLAKLIVNTHIPKGTIFNIDYLNDDFVLEVKKPVKKTKSA